jgi:hypothetical protein
MCVLAGLSLLLPDSGLTAIWSWKQDEYRALLGAAPASGVGFLLLGSVMAIASRGCFGRRRWGWILACLLIAINAAGDAVRGAMVIALRGSRDWSSPPSPLVDQPPGGSRPFQHS